ncbi:MULTISPECIES: DcaP family trimeric outer membrane transporter [unclassified Pseudoalteromonas]|uniref:DcaP family trimeric outer membrane transporter n=1 Tax=unclassified Pseudoalteromonas TaxID=194690 RepID=UPI001107BC5C|nr:MULTISPECIES: DcaP family trimeric outer membrane transporter [unclassified Pseudoalteromonas]TMN85931.1 porin [Pseudoalteromonas sp. S410]TMN93259.1 porin [Pseudoalteromonas sp. S408]TMN99750.1 porin [Pseudoalteromonas sp. S407]TMO00526.1 porin [Pseudoalteromonas sp. S409]TMO12541.1 porin [Pseudoalteromonas sp. S186]
MKFTLLKTLAASAVLCALSSTSYAATAAKIGDTEFTYGGYIKLDTMWSDYSAGASAGTSVGRDFYVPSTLTVGDDDSSDAVFDMHARQSRFNFGTSTLLDNGKKINSKIEIDFLASAAGGNERVSNSFAPRIRHAFITYDGWLFGQTWSNFQNVGALPETLDFVGPAEGTVFVRQAQIKYTTGAWSFSLENPESTITTAGGSRVATDDASLPDFTARYTHKADWGNLVVTALARQLTYKVGSIDADETSFGISASGMFKVGDDNIKFMLTQGKGLGRYVGLNVAHGAVLNGDELDAIDSTSGFVAYQHKWNSQWRSTFLYSFFSADNNTDLLSVSGDPTESTQSYSANILYSPVKRLTFGAELKHAERETQSGVDGNLDRLQFSVKYAF